jgi:hypothetical protein
MIGFMNLNNFEKVEERGQKYLITVYLAITLIRCTNTACC